MNPERNFELPKAAQEYSYRLREFERSEVLRSSGEGLGFRVQGLGFRV